MAFDMRRAVSLGIGAVALGLALVAGCGPRLRVTIASPAHGSFTTAGSVTATGVVTGVTPANASLIVNGNPVPIATDGTWSASLLLDPDRVFQPILADLTNLASGQRVRDRVVIHRGESRADGEFSEKSLALRVNDLGLEQLGPVIAERVGFDPAALLPPGTVVFPKDCLIDGGFLGCLGSAEGRIDTPAPSLSSFEIALGTEVGRVNTAIVLNDLVVNVRIDGSGTVPNCDLRLTATATQIGADLVLAPDAAQPARLDVSQSGIATVVFENFDQEFTSGSCDDAIIGDIIQGIIGDLEGEVRSGLEDFLNEVDGAGNTPLAGALEGALGGVSIAGPLGESLGVALDAPFFTVLQEVDGLTLGADAAFLSDTGTDPGQCLPPPGAPDLQASLHTTAPLPALGPLTPSGVPYGLGIALGTSALNQLLKAQVECGLLVTTLDELAIPPLIPEPVPITSDLLASFLPPFGDLAPGTLLRIEITPSLAPVVVGRQGPQGELATLEVAALAVRIVDAGTGAVLLGVDVDAETGLDLAFDDASSEVAITLSAPAAADVEARVRENPLGVNEALLEQFLLPQLVRSLLPDLASGLGAFPLPSFLGLALEGVEVAREGEFLLLFTDLVLVPPPLPDPTIPVAIFADDFNRAGSDTVGNGWFEHADDAADIAIFAGGVGGTGAVRLRDDFSGDPNQPQRDTDLWHDVSTVGFGDIRIEFDWAVDAGQDSEDGDFLFVGWRIGNTGAFTDLASFPLGGPEGLFTHESFSLGIGAEDLSQIQIRFSTDVNNNDEGATLDNVQVIGTLLPAP